jgi:hypothetical protein
MGLIFQLTKHIPKLRGIFPTRLEELIDKREHWQGRQITNIDLTTDGTSRVLCDRSLLDAEYEMRYFLKYALFYEDGTTEQFVESTPIIFRADLRTMHVHLHCMSIPFNRYMQERETALRAKGYSIQTQY